MSTGSLTAQPMQPMQTISADAGTSALRRGLRCDMTTEGRGTTVVDARWTHPWCAKRPTSIERNEKTCATICANKRAQKYVPRRHRDQARAMKNKDGGSGNGRRSQKISGARYRNGRSSANSARVLDKAAS